MMPPVQKDWGEYEREQEREWLAQPRFVFIKEKQFGFGLRWLTEDYYPFKLHLSLFLPFVSIDIGVGGRNKRRSL